MKKEITYSVILLFIGLAFIPSIYANVPKAEITAKLFGINGASSSTVKLTQEQVDELGALLDHVKEQLHKTETRQQAIEIFNEAIVELDKYKLLGGLSVEQAQKLITRQYQNQRLMKLTTPLFKTQSLSDGNRNFLCLIAGNTTRTGFASLRSNARFIIKTMITEYLGLSYWLYFLIGKFWLFHTSLCDFMYFGGYNIDHYPANGWIWTQGMLGVREWNGSLYGQIGKGFSVLTPFLVSVDIGAIGFTGIIIIDVNSGKSSYLGSSLSVNIGYEPP